MFDGVIQWASNNWDTIWSVAKTGASYGGQNLYNIVKSVFGFIIHLLSEFIDSITIGFGFKFSDILSKIADFISGSIDFIFSFINIFPSPFNVIFSFSFMFILFLVIYKFIRG